MFSLNLQVDMATKWIFWVVIVGVLFGLASTQDFNAIITKKPEAVYNHTAALILVKFASAAYTDDQAALQAWTCHRCGGLIQGFQLSEVIVDVPNSLQAIVGIAENLPAIVVAFRGTQETSFQNWLADLYFTQLDFNYPSVKDAMVHHGFYSAYHNTTLQPHIVAAVQSLLQQRNGFSVMVTGHSMGGALASFCALDLVNYNIQDVQVVTFGQPRIGNPIFASFYDSSVPKTIRMTHGHDIIPHLPPYYTILEERTYHHVAREVWIYTVDFGILTYETTRVCDETGEDPTCSRSVFGDSISDHLMYLGTVLRTEHSSDSGWWLSERQYNSL
ncbi:hypothetical protein O6H91_06G026900 [Diphasiastrum complanatum]|uniref:Uncharacterized protein n=1 Tax=Diphasiastrum complanatum TaxID=34168 RepID=A0ACC2DBU7_DIPCM|nr:hypothetical protein O6H91_06G026900 [Diphasiastrum complanatum]